MPKGPAPKSKKALQRDGSWRAGDRPDDLELEPTIPDPPARLSKDERAAWNEIMEVLGPKRVVTQGDLGSLELLVCELVRYRKRKKQLERQDRAGGDVMALRRIESSMKEAFANYVNMASRFGLTPADRTRVKIQDKPKSNDGKGRFFGDTGVGVIGSVGKKVG